MSSAAVSVIVPCYNVERYLDECLASVVAQTISDIEIICIDDGSTDGTSEILRRWQTVDERITVIGQRNGGLGAARNAGVKMATGTFLFFLDSDDRLPEESLELLLASARSSGSDIVSGVAVQFDRTGAWPAAQYGELFDGSRQGLHINEEPALVRDQIACSKIFKRQFWLHNDLSFPEGTLYEDLAVVMRAYVRASSVDVVSAPTYCWRRHDDGEPSITQDRYRVGTARQRFASLQAADSFLQAESTDRVQIAHGVKICTVDLRLYARLLEDSPDGWSAEFIDAANMTLRGLHPGVRAQLSTPMQLLVESFLRSDLVAIGAATSMLSTSEGRKLRPILSGILTMGIRSPGVLVAALRHR